MAANPLQLVLGDMAVSTHAPEPRPPLSAPPKAERMKCVCGAEHFFVTKVDFTCTVCFKSYRD